MNFSLIPALATLFCFLAFRDWPTVSAMALAWIAYCYELREERKREHTATMIDLETKVTAVMDRLKVLEDSSETTVKQADDVRKLISQSQLASAFAARK